MKELRKQTEEQLHLQVVNYLKYQYPKVIFRTDFASGIKMTIGQAKKHKSLQYSRAYPDLFIAETNSKYSGLFLELKREGLKIHKKNGEYLNSHLKEQACMIDRLRAVGYYADFVIGFDEAKHTIDYYLNIEKGKWDVFF